MNKKKLKIECEKAYQVALDNKYIVDLNGSVGFKIGWEAAVKLFSMHTVVGRSEQLPCCYVCKSKVDENDNCTRKGCRNA
jgi:hypothetical protein